MKAFDDTTARLMQLASANDEAGFKAAFAPMAGTCGACHQAYRN